MPQNSYEILARERKARKLADVMVQKIDAFEREFHRPVDLNLLLTEDSVNTRRACELAAGVNPGSRETWELVIGFLRERAAARRIGAK